MDTKLTFTFKEGITKADIIPMLNDIDYLILLKYSHLVIKNDNVSEGIKMECPKEQICKGRFECPIYKEYCTLRAPKKVY
jgi:hypothetical protein